MDADSVSHAGASAALASSTGVARGSAPSVFISYRRSDTAELVEGLAALLRHDLGGEQIFRDSDDLIAGERWKDAIRDRIGSSDAAVFLIGTDWQGGRRIDKIDDPVRFEVELAVSAESLATPIPVLVDPMAVPTGPPACIDELLAHHAVTATRDELLSDSGAAYQALLVGLWAAIRDRLGGGLIVIADGSERGSVAIDELVRQLAREDPVGVRELSRFASGALILEFDDADVVAAERRWPDVVILGDSDRPSPRLAARVRAVSAHPTLERVVLIGAGAAAVPAAGLAVQTFDSVGQWASGVGVKPARWGRRVLSAHRARPRTVAAGLLAGGVLGAAALVASPPPDVGARFEHAGFEFEISDVRTLANPPGTAFESEDPDPLLDHRQLRVRMTNLGFDTSTALRFADIDLSRWFSLELSDDTRVPSEGSLPVDDSRSYFRETLFMTGVDQAEFWLSFAVPSGTDARAEHLHMQLGKVVPSRIATDTGNVKTLVVPVDLTTQVYEGVPGCGENTLRVEVSDVTASFEAGFDESGEPLPSPDFGLRRRAEDGFVLVRFEATASMLTDTCYVLLDPPRAIVDGEEMLDRGGPRHMPSIRSASATFRGFVEVPVDAGRVSIGIGASSPPGSGEDFLYVAELNPSFLEDFRTANS